MAKENEREVEEIEELDESDESLDWKAEALKSHGMAKRYLKSHKELQELRQAQAEAEAKSKAEKAAEEAKAKTPESAIKKEFDYGELAFLEAKDIAEKHHPFILEEINATGKSLKAVLAFRHMQDELKSRDEVDKVDKAIPSGGKRVDGAARDSVEYWLAMVDRGESTVSDIPDFELRNKVVAARIKREKDGQGQFTDRPIA